LVEKEKTNKTSPKKRSLKEGMSSKITSQKVAILYGTPVTWSTHSLE